MLPRTPVCFIRHLPQAIAVATCLALSGCASPQVGDAAGSISKTSSTGTADAQADSGAADAFATLLGGAALGAMAVAGASGEVGQQALAEAAASADNPEAASIAGAIQTATAPLAAANDADSAQYGGGIATGGGNCEALLRQADGELAGYHFESTPQQIEATMYVLNKQITIIDQSCPQSADVANLRALRVQQFDAAQRACNQISVKSQCVAQLPGQYDGIGSNAVVVEDQGGSDPGASGPRPMTIKQGCSNSGSADGRVCVVQ